MSRGGLATLPREGRWWHYLDDGRYGSFSGQLYDRALHPVDGLRPRAALPELGTGDLIVGRMMGACTTASATDFEFIPRARIVAVKQ